MGHEIFLARLPSRGGHDHRLDRLAPALVGHRDHGCLHDRGVLEQGVLHLDRVDDLAAGVDDVLLAVDDVDVAFPVEDRQVSGVKPASLEGCPSRLLVLPVPGRHARTADYYLADGLAVCGHVFALLVDDAKVHSHQRPTGAGPVPGPLLVGQGAYREGRPREGQVGARLGQAVGLQVGAAEGLAHAPDQLG